MTILVKNATGAQFQLSGTKPATPVAAAPQNLDRLVKEIKLVKPATWNEAWKLLFPFTAFPDSQEKMLQAINAAVTARKLHLTPVSAGAAGSDVEFRGHRTAKGSGKSSQTDSLPPPKEDAKAHLVASETLESCNDQGAISHVKPGSVASAATTGAASVAHTCTRGCPISMVSGEELLSLTDFSLPGPLPFAWKRTYRTGHNRDLGLGHGWTHAGCESLYEGADFVELRDDEGRILTFKRPRPNQRSKLLNEQMDLDAVSYEEYVLRQQGQPTRVFNRLGQTGAFRLTQIQHPAYIPPKSGETEQGFALNFYYDAYNALVGIVGNWGRALQFMRDAQGRITRITLKDHESQLSRIQAEYDYSTEGDQVAQRDSTGRGESYIYSHHLLQKRTLATGFSYYYEWDREDTRARCLHTWGDNGIYDYRFQWDPENNRSQATDSRGYTSRFVYNQFGLVTEETDNEGGIHRYTYDKGLRTSYIDPEGNVTRYSYDSANNLSGVIDALDQRQTRYYFQGKLVTSTDKDGALWRRSYNPRGLMESLTAPDGQTSRFRYNQHGLLVEQRVARERATRYQWNDAGELTSLTTPEGHRQVFTYNPWGQLIQMDLWLASRQHGGTTRYHYSAAGELERVIYPNGERVDIRYNANGQVERISDRRGRVTRYEYDGLSQVIRRTDAEGNSLGYAYDTERNLVKLINENGDEYCFIYDGNERLIKETGFDGRIQHYKYNKAGHLIKQLDAGEIVTEFERDPLGRMLGKTSRSLVDAKAAPEVNRYLYDPAGRLKETYNSSQYLTFSYDRMGYLVKEHHSDINENRQRISDSMVDIHYQRTPSGQLKKLTLPDGQAINYHYDDANRLQQVAVNGAAITTIERDDLGREINRQQGELTTHSNYDPMGRLVKQQAMHRQQKTGVINREYHYDPFGNLSSFKDGSWEVRYVYDMVDRLKRSEGDLTESFVFDPAGNLLGQKKGESGKTQRGNRLVLQGDRKFTYDARGNLIRETRGKGGQLETVFAYNFNNQLTRVVKGSQTIDYAYDPIGRRIRKQDHFGTTQYLWAGDQLAQEQRSSLKKTYVYEPDSFKPLALLQDEKIYHYHLDHLGTPRELTNQQGNVVWKVKYKTYGNVALKEVEDVENNLRFQGQYFDEETGLHYNRHRYFDPSAGQFTTQDPIGLLGGVNNYQYAPNPTGWVDPLGLTCKENGWNAFQKNTAGHFASSSDAAQSYKTAKEVAKMGSNADKINRPDVSAYLPQSYIDKHIEEFNAVGCAFIVIQGWISNPKHKSFPERKFVGLRTEMDAVIARYEAANRDWRVLRDDLSLGKNVDLSNDEIAFVVVEPDDPRFSYDMPTGRESGAYENEWIPLGKTKGGTKEAALVGAETVLHNNDIDKIVGQFPGSKRIK